MSAILLTGATGRVGTAVVERLASPDNRFALVGRRADALDRLAADLAAEGVESHPIAADLAARDAPATVVARAVELLGGIDVLVNNAAAFGFRPFADAGPELIDRIVDVNLRAVLQLTHGALRPLSEARRPAIVNVASTAGLDPVPEAAVYSATKAAMIAFGDAFRDEARARGIALCTVVPGQLRLTDDEGAAGIPPAKVAEAVASVVEATAPMDLPARIIVDAA
jgi:short-subunit dehydrogenase